MKEVVLAVLTFFIPMGTTATNMQLTEERVQVSERERVTIIGDSLTVSIASKLNQIANKEIYIDGEIGRQVRELPDVYEKVRGSGQLGEILVIELGTNGPYQAKVIQQVIDDARENGVQQFYLVNVRMDRSWQDAVNQTHEELVRENAEDTKLINWFQTSKNKGKYFASDGVHLSEAGKYAYVNLLGKYIGDK